VFHINGRAHHARPKAIYHYVKEGVFMKVLIVVDMQNDFISEALGTSEAIVIVPNVVDKIKSFEGRVFATYDTHYADYLNTQEGRNLPVEHCLTGTHGWNLHSDVFAALETKAGWGKVKSSFMKPTFGAVDLAKHLCDLDDGMRVSSIELVGLCTDICVISNALLMKAFMPEIPIIVDASCCAGVTPESHMNALAAMKMCQINIINE
jgi:nicotinamidase-related amidase